MDDDENDDNDRVKSICDGLRRGLSRAGLEPLPEKLQELLRLLQSKEQNRAHAHGSADHAPGDGTPDSCWKLGLFYYNPGDSALFVEKRIGIGYTLNFARPVAWALMAMTLLIPPAIVALVAWKH